MGDYVIMTDSSCDLPTYLVKELGLYVLPLSFYLDDKKYMNYTDEREILNKDFYELIRKKKQAKTSGINVSDFINEMEKLLRDGKNILYLGFSSKLSCTYSNAVVAVNELKGKYPERKIYTVDTKCASLGQGLLTYLVSKGKIDGLDIDKAFELAENLKLKICHWFTVDDLFYLKRGGRISGATAAIGSLLGIKPLLHVDNEGCLIGIGKVRGRKSSLDFIINKVKESAVNIAEQVVFISHGDCIEDAEYVANELKNRFKVKDVVINYVGPVIGCHSGPGTLAVFFVGKER